MNPKPLRQIDLHSDAGRIEALYREIPDARAVAVVCHPHPLGGGTLHNKVVFRAARGLEAANVATIRFNFRGVGASHGKHEEGEGEVNDFIAALDWITKKHPGTKVIAGGFSFGSWVASRAACDLPRVDAVFLIGAPVNKYDFTYLRFCDKPMLFLQGTQDEFGEVAKLERIVERIRNAETIFVTGADHFFTKQIDAVEETLRNWATELLEEPKK
ncbi:MAG TPA: alpha/beta fold hydrolase [Thermoanaerobaculia bacterium]|nr:alpha/beta fold hydrolase [Thermoanaerobaculia bacterium]